MPRCKNSSCKYYTGKEPSPKGLGYCAYDEKEGKIMKGRDGNMWIKKNGKWVKDNTKTVKDIVRDDEYYEDYYEEKLDKKLYKWWQKLSAGNIIIIYKNGKHKLITSSMKTHTARHRYISDKWYKYGNDDNVEAIIWSAQSIDSIQEFISYLIENNTRTQLDKLIKIKDLPSYLLKNYKKYFLKYKFSTDKDYVCFKHTNYF